MSWRDTPPELSDRALWPLAPGYAACNLSKGCTCVDWDGNDDEQEEAA